MCFSPAEPLSVKILAKLLRTKCRIPVHPVILKDSLS